MSKFIKISCDAFVKKFNSEIKYIDDYKNDELVKEYCDQLKVDIIKL